MQKNRDDLMGSRAAKLTNWKLVDIIEFVEILKKEYGEDISKIEDQTCPICCCDLYEDIQNKSEEEIQKLGNEQRSLMAVIDVVIMSKCKAHFFHAECLNSQLGDKQFLKCALCNYQYGHETGNQPNGTMTVQFNNNKLPGHEKDSVGTWNIHYSVQGGKNEKGSFSGDSRSAYLPSNAEGDEVLALF